MDARQFFDKVAYMRKCQKEYFRTRSATALRQSKAVEAEIDREIERVNNLLGKQPQQKELGLFDNQK